MEEIGTARDRNGAPVGLGSLVTLLALPEWIMQEAEEIEAAMLLRAAVGRVFEVVEIDAWNQIFVEIEANDDQGLYYNHTLRLEPSMIEIYAH